MSEEQQQDPLNLTLTYTHVVLPEGYNREVNIVYLEKPDPRSKRSVTSGEERHHEP